MHKVDEGPRNRPCSIEETALEAGFSTELQHFSPLLHNFMPASHHFVCELQYLK